MVRLPAAMGRSPCSTWISTLGWLSLAVLKVSLLGSAEEAKQAGWVAALVAGRYFADDFEVEMCPHCDRWFAAGTTHEHLAVGGRIVPHHFRLHRAQLAAGFRPSWAPAAAADEPSLEELGTLDAPRDLP